MLQFIEGRAKVLPGRHPAMLRTQFSGIATLNATPMAQRPAVRSVLAVALLNAFAAQAFAQLLPGSTHSNESERTIPLLNQSSQHTHQPMVIRSRPVIERIPVRTVTPTDICISSSGITWVADPGAKAVFRIDLQASVSLAFSELAGIQRIQTDPDGNLYVLTSSSAESSVLQFTTSGKRLTLFQFPYPGVCFARTSVGEFLIASKDSLHRFEIDGTKTSLPLPQRPLDMTSNPGGGIELLLEGGTVVSTSGLKSFSHPRSVHPLSTRILHLPEGELVSLVSTSDTSQRAGLFSLSPQNDPAGHVPQTWLPIGTAAVGFDKLGNLTLANPQLQALTKVTSKFQVPCPHCQRPLLLHLDAAADPPADNF